MQTVLIGLISNHKWLLLQYVLRTNKDFIKRKKKKSGIGCFGIWWCEKSLCEWLHEWFLTRCCTIKESSMCEAMWQEGLMSAREIFNQLRWRNQSLNIHKLTRAAPRTSPWVAIFDQTYVNNSFSISSLGFLFSFSPLIWLYCNCLKWLPRGVASHSLTGRKGSFFANMALTQNQQQ